MWSTSDGKAPITTSRPGSDAPEAAQLSGRLVVVGTYPSDVDRIAGAAATDLLSVVISG